MIRWFAVWVLGVFAVGVPGLAQTDQESALQTSIEELRGSIGKWQVTTEFLNADGSVARAVEGTYEFSWVVPDRVAMGQNAIPELELASGILFYINESKGTVEMVSVGRDGRLWIMTGPMGGSQRTTQEFQTAAGTTRQLRFTRYHVTAEGFESKMEYTDDGGETWTPGNHQVFRRAEKAG